MAGTFVDRDLGDLMWNGNINPTGYRVDGTAELWLWRHRVNQPGGGYGLVAGSTGSAIHVNEGWPSALAERVAPGATIDRIVW